GGAGRRRRRREIVASCRRGILMRVAVVGLGLIGGSAALALGARGYDRDPGARARARDRGIDAAESLPEAVRRAEVVLIAVSTEETPALLLQAAAAAPDALLTDASSLKRPVAACAAALPAGTRFVAGHPMAGSKTPGLERSEEHTSELQSRFDLVCRLLLEK